MLEKMHVMHFKLRPMSTSGWELGVKTGSEEKGVCMQRSTGALIYNLHCCQ